MIIQPSDSLLQRSFLSPAGPTTTLQQPQIITVNHQPIKTETLHTNSPSTLTSISSLQQKPIIKTENDLADDNLRHLVHDDRFIPAMLLKKRLHELGLNQ